MLLSRLYELLHEGAALTRGEVAPGPLDARIAARPACEDAHRAALGRELLHEVAAEMTGAACHKNGVHASVLPIEPCERCDEDAPAVDGASARCISTPAAMIQRVAAGGSREAHEVAMAYDPHGGRQVRLAVGAK